MSIEDRVTKAVESLGKGEPESALHDICSAVDMTATILYGKPGKESYKNFIHDNSDIITKISGSSGMSVQRRKLFPEDDIKVGFSEALLRCPMATKKRPLTVLADRGQMHHWRSGGLEIPCQVAAPRAGLRFSRRMQPINDGDIRASLIGHRSYA